MGTSGSWLEVFPCTDLSFLSVGNSSISMIDLPPDTSKALEAPKNGTPESPPFIAPAGFRPNSTFYGFERQLKDLEVALQDEARISLGSSSALVCGPPGSGKTHLVRQYLFTHLDHYPAGIFWVDSRSEESRLKSFWDIVQATTLNDSNGLFEEESYGLGDFVGTVKKWLESKVGWLLIFDGVTIESEEVMSKYMRYLPDRRGNDIIFTSVDKNLCKRQRLFCPTAVPLPPLTEQEACLLLYNRIGITKPSSKQAAKAQEIVKYFQCLPLAIHATGHRILARGQALEKFHVESSSTDQRLAEPFIGIMHDLEELNHIEAMNLLNILSFFDHQIPVAILSLGRKGLPVGVDIRAPDHPGSIRRNLDETIAVLIRYGLCERSLERYRVHARQSPNETRRTGTNSSKEYPFNVGFPPKEESGFDTSSSSSSSYAIDVIRVHTAVQSFCRDNLRDSPDSTYESWLSVSTALLLQAYRSAEDKVMKGQRVLSRDYREFETQAARLLRHFPHKQEIKYLSLLSMRRELRKLRSDIRILIQRGSPTQSLFDDDNRRLVSVFDRSGSDYSDGPTTPSTASPSRKSTFNSFNPAIEESPTDLRPLLQLTPRLVTGSQTQAIGSLREEDSPFQIPRIANFPVRRDGNHGRSPEYQNRALLHRPDFDDAGYGSDLDLPGSVFESTTVSPTASEDIERSATLAGIPGNRAPRVGSPDALIRQIFEGRTTKSRGPKNLGEWHAPPRASVTPIAATADSHMKPRTYSSISTGSEAEAALSRVHRISPPAFRGGSQAPRSVSRSRLSSENKSTQMMQGKSRRRSDTEYVDAGGTSVGDPRDRPDLFSTSPLTDASPLQETPASTMARDALSYSLNPFYFRYQGQSPLPFSRNVTVTKLNTIDKMKAVKVAAWKPNIRGGGDDGGGPSPESTVLKYSLPSGYTSTPMSRDVSKESQYSGFSEPSREPPQFSPDGGTSFKPPGTEDRDICLSNSPPKRLYQSLSPQ